MIEKLERPDGHWLSYELLQASADQVEQVPCLLFCGGFCSDMMGSKAEFIMDYACKRGLAALRFDYFAHGASSGDFALGTIGRWLDDTLCVMDSLAPKGPLVLIGSSMGGWLATAAALKRANRMHALVLLAAAPDFTRRLMWTEMNATEQQKLMDDGLIEQENDYSDQPYRIYRDLILEADQHLLLNNEPLVLDCPVRLMHGLKDMDVPWQLALELAEKLTSADVSMNLIKAADHRLSREEDLLSLGRCLDSLV